MREAGFSHGLDKSAEGDCPAPWFVNFWKNGLSCYSSSSRNMIHLFQDISRLSCVLTSCALFTGRLASKEETHDTILDGSLTILNFFGICERFFCLRKGMRFGLEMCKTRDKESETSFSLLESHREYRHTRDS